MKRILVLAACILLGSATVATAVDVGWLEGVVTPYSGSTNKVDIYVISTTYPGGLINGIEGTWSLSDPGARFFLEGTTFNWRDNTRSALVTGVSAPQTAINFFTANTAATWSRTVSGDGYSSLAGGWFTAAESPDYRLTPVDPDLGDGFDQTLLATFYVDGASTLRFDGEFGLTTGVVVGGFGVSVVPEPGSLILLLSGALSLLGLVWLRRR